jgi:hypothetical protein
MRWMFIGLLVSLCGLLVAVAAMVRHVLRHRREQAANPAPAMDAHTEQGTPEA